MRNARIIGTGRALPARVVTNQDLEKIVETSDAWIKDRSGIEKRHISTGETGVDLALSAARQAIEKANIHVAEIDLVIVATVSPDALTPATACVLAKKLKLKNPMAFDLSAGCSGFVYALTVAKQFIQTAQANKVLVVGVELLSKLTNWGDRSTCVLFGDGAGACILSACAENGILNTYMGSDGDVAQFLHIPGPPLKNPFYHPGAALPMEITMDGPEIFKFATRIIKKSIQEILKDTNITLDMLKYIVPHQANRRIIEYVADKFHIDSHKFYVNLDEYGNTSAASIPIALDEMNEKKMLAPEDKILLLGFGGGLTWGAVLLTW